MKTVINGSIYLLILLLIPSVPFAAYSYQTNWSGGPGVPGPTTWWGGSFSSQDQTSWTVFPGKLFLELTSICHTISNDIEGCRYAFPADMDGDGDIDVIAQADENWDVAWFENDGSGGGWNIHVVRDSFPVFSCAYPGDLDGDGDMDVAGANTSSTYPGIEWWRNEDGYGEEWTRFRIDCQFGSPRFVCTADINNDDTLEVVAPSYTSPSQIAWWESSTTPPDSVWEKHLVSGSSPDGLELFPIDLDQDGDMDILSACWNSAGLGGLAFWENADGVGLSWIKHAPGYELSPRSVHAADIDSDGDFDVLCCGSHNEHVTWWENLDGSCMNWKKHFLETNFDMPYGIHAADVTDDGYVDILVVNRHDPQYFYRSMDGSGFQWARYILHSGTYFEDVDTADFNGDGFKDVLLGAPYLVIWYELSGYSSGWLESSIHDVTGYPQWDSIAWTAEEPPGTDLFFQVKSSNDWEDMGAWCDTIFEPGSLAGYVDSTHRYIQYRVGMTSDSRFGTPVLEEVRFYWSNLGIEGSEGTEEFVITAVPNPSGGGVSIEVPSVYAEGVELLVYDLSGKLVRKLSERNGSIFFWDGCDSSGDEAPSGSYIIRGIVEDRSASVRFVKL